MTCQLQTKSRSKLYIFNLCTNIYANRSIPFKLLNIIASCFYFQSHCTPNMYCKMIRHISVYLMAPAHSLHAF